MSRRGGALRRTALPLHPRPTGGWPRADPTGRRTADVRLDVAVYAADGIRRLPARPVWPRGYRRRPATRGSPELQLDPDAEPEHLARLLADRHDDHTQREPRGRSLATKQADRRTVQVDPDGGRPSGSNDPRRRDDPASTQQLRLDHRPLRDSNSGGGEASPGVHLQQRGLLGDRDLGELGWQGRRRD